MRVGVVEDRERRVAKSIEASRSNVARWAGSPTGGPSSAAVSDSFWGPGTGKNCLL